MVIVPTFKAAPVDIFQPKWNEYGTSPGQQAMPTFSGREMSWKVESGIVAHP